MVLVMPFVADDLAEAYTGHVDQGSRFGQMMCLRNIDWLMKEMERTNGRDYVDDLKRLRYLDAALSYSQRRTRSLQA